jgi:arylformamidase
MSSYTSKQGVSNGVRHVFWAAGLLITLSILPPVCAAEDDDDLIRFRLARVRDVAIQRQNERVLGKVVSASRTMSTNWNAITTQDKLKLVRDGETALELSPVEELPKGTTADRIPFAVPRKQFLDVPFTTIEGVEAKHLSLDVYSPGIDKKHPMVVWSHGGGFVSGDKAHPLLSVAKSDFFLSRGFVFVSVNYRLAPKHKFPAQAEDTAAALAYLHGNAAKFGGDPDNLFLIGDSAGGQLVSIVSTNEGFLKKHGKTLDIIRGTVVLDIGSFDVPSIMDRLGKDAPKQYHDTFRDNRGEWIAASPILHVGPDKKIPSMLLFFVSGRQHHDEENRRFAVKMKEHGYSAQVVEVKDRTHHTLAYNIGTQSDPATEKIIEFIANEVRTKK